MKDLKLTKNFYLFELVPEEIYKKWGNKSVWFLDMKAVNALQFYREYFGVPVYCNTWKNHPGSTVVFHYRGFRPPGCTVGAEYSQHRFGRGIDSHMNTIEPMEARVVIRRNWEVFRNSGLTTIEKDTESWLHFDTRHTGKDTLLEVNG